MSRLKTIIVDDTMLVRNELKSLLNDYPEIDVIGVAENIDNAVKLINTHNPDVIFLDIQLKGETGFDLFEKADISAKIIFITAYDQYAIRAFEVNALDYLLKPINKERLSIAISRLLPKERIYPGHQNKLNYNDVIYVNINGSLKFVKIPLLKCIIAEGKYSYIIYGDNKKDLISKTLQEWENILPEKYFIRIHRSTIVNFEHVEKVKKCRNYTNEVYIIGIDEPFIISRRFAVKLKKYLV
ncbi:response regulator transcription factor [candidate division KSB1 bacterium]|nr:response regulator transcription factor [candidate division KSB1 bacterium]